MPGSRQLGSIRSRHRTSRIVAGLLCSASLPRKSKHGHTWPPPRARVDTVQNRPESCRPDGAFGTTHRFSVTRHPMRPPSHLIRPLTAQAISSDDANWRMRPMDPGEFTGGATPRRGNRRWHTAVTSIWPSSSLPGSASSVPSWRSRFESIRTPADRSPMPENGLDAVLLPHKLTRLV